MPGRVVAMVLFLAAALVLAVLAVLQIPPLDDVSFLTRVLGAIVVPILVLVIIQSVALLLERVSEPVLTLTKAGVVARQSSRDFIPWEKVIRVEAMSFRGIILGVDLQLEPKFASQLTWSMWHRLWRAGFSGVRITLSTSASRSTMTNAELLALAQKFWHLARGKEDDL